MKISDTVALGSYSTMGLGGTAAHLTTVETRIDLLEALSWAQSQQLPVIMIGGGSNILWRDEGFNGLVIVNKIERYETFKEDDDNVYITAGAGEHWDTVVERTAQAGLSGIECLSLIPGSVGATPIQNVGAYGQEIAQTLVTIEAFDTQIGDFVTIPGSDCAFGYRTSRFKTTDRGRFFISAITLHLMRTTIQPPFYPALKAYLDAHGISDLSPKSIREAVLAIRRERLPDPALIHNSGSFFGNPIISSSQVMELHNLYPSMPSWMVDENLSKISAAWLIEQTGFKAIHDDTTGMSVWPAQPLVLVNEKARTTADALAFKQKIVDAVQAKFGISLTQEPELLPY